MRHSERGQAMIETAFFLPVMLIAMVAIIYFSRFGILQERAPIAARYASLVSNAGTNNASVFSIQEMYAELRREASDPRAMAPQGSGACSTFAKGDAQATLTQRTTSDGASSRTAPPYFQPIALSDAPTNCETGVLSLPTTNADIASAYFSVQYTHVNAQQEVPAYLQPIIGVVTGVVLAGMSNVRPASPSNILYCSSAFAGAIANYLGPSEPAPQAAPYAGYYPPSVSLAPHC